MTKYILGILIYFPLLIACGHINYDKEIVKDDLNKISIKSYIKGKHLSVSKCKQEHIKVKNLYGVKYGKYISETNVFAIVVDNDNGSLKK